MLNPAKIIVPFFFSICTILPSCKKCEQEESRYEIKAFIKEAIPYTNGQIIKFKSNWGNTVVTEVKDESKFITYDECHECCDSLVRLYEFLTINLVDTLQNYNLVELVTNYDSDSSITVTLIDSFWNHGARGSSFSFGVSSNGEVSCTSIGVICHDSIVINNTAYYHVIEFPFDYYTPYKHFETFFYSGEKGVLRYKYNTGEIFELDE